MRRLLVSPWSFVAISLAAVVGLLSLIPVLENRARLDADAQAALVAETMAAAMIQPHLKQALATGRLTQADAAGLHVEIGELRKQGRLLGVGVWRLDGRELFVDQTPESDVTRPSDSYLRRAVSGRPWSNPGISSIGGSELRVFLPAPVGAADRADDGALVEMVIPHERFLQAVEHQLSRLQSGSAVVTALLLGGLSWLQYRLRRRERHARQDLLTGLLNRRALHKQAGHLVARATDASPVALLLLDLNDFKAVNDTLGHAAGDLLLRQVAATLTAAVRPGDLVARLGGDEFAVLLAGLSSTAAAQPCAEHVLERLRAASFDVQGLDLVTDASIGVALAPEHGTTVSDLLRRADVAMYQAKLGRQGTAVYDADADRHTVGQLAMVTELRRALEHDEFLLHYQPKYSLADGRVTSAEALVRWQHPTRGLLLPGEFLTVLERAGLMSELTRWVLRTAVRQAAAWRGGGLCLPVAVNISPESLLERDLPARVVATLTGAELPASFLELEITESAVMKDPARAAAVLRGLHARGIGVAIDDFGAGYTSLAHLRNLPITALKIDRSLISHILERSEDEAVTQALIDLAHRLGIRVVAEGAETREVLGRLTEMGCDEVQGYVISAPLDPAGLEEWLANMSAGTLAGS